MARRFAFAIALFFVVPLGGSMRAESAPAPPALPMPASPVRTARAKPPAKPRVHHIRRRAPGTLVARVRSGHAVLVRSRGAVTRISSRTEFGSPQTFAVTRLSPGRHYRVLLPDGRTGWIHAAPGTFTLSRARVSLEVDLSARVLRVRRGSRVTRVIRVGTGAPSTPTPIGRFAITDKLDGAAFSPVYGCCILALSAHQTHLPAGWTGGNLIAIHGGSTAGAISTGCLHAATADLRYLMRVAPLGTLVVVHP
jgi:lipoprotein-anchoring transpeptidase ErfK/SrfK